MKLAVLDIEVFINLFICQVYLVSENKIIGFEVSERRNDLKALIEFLISGKYIIVGYNCTNYDTPILNALIIYQNVLVNSAYSVTTSKCKELSDLIINKDTPKQSWSKYKYANFFKQMDLMTMMASQALRVSLKSLQITMCYNNVKESMLDWSKAVLLSEIDSIISYCNNDITSTRYLLKLLLDDIKFRTQVVKEFNIDCLSMDGVGVGVSIFTKYICEDLDISQDDLYSLRKPRTIIPIKDIIIPVIKFKTKEFQKLHDWYSSIVIDLHEYEKLSDEEKKERYKFVVNFDGLPHAYGLGGMHSQNTPTIVTSNEESYLDDEDVESYYPNLSEKWSFGPAGFREPFIRVISFLKEGRIHAKNTGDKVKNQLYKLALNSILGNLKNKYSPFYDPEANLGICINGQLLLSMLIEDLSLIGITCISSNTDGATFRVPYVKQKQYEAILKEWQTMSRMKLESTKYEKMVIVAVNDYLAFKEGYSKIKDKIDFDLPERSVSYNGVELLIKDEENSQLRNKYVKEKGMFITTPRLTKGLDFLIVPKAIQNFFGKGIPIDKTIRDFRSIHDYVKTQKVGKQFDVFWNNEKQQHMNRFYVKRNAPTLLKSKYVEKDFGNQTLKIRSNHNLLKGEGVELVNDLTETKGFNIDYQYYIRKCNKILRQLQPSQMTLF